ncbi:hypothetical protein N0V84_012473 [Fusarium piperis]|uniref:Uncharacterized protein n=1 Tax=Fusarium piperis TaxID=1435070 RepID=A0A9W8W291_9HYPO|nr:hypothetical protein N0V84_012473 [Fusarium piperis]
MAGTQEVSLQAGGGMAVGSLGVPMWVSHVQDVQSLVVHDVSGSGANLKRLDTNARMVPEGDKAPTSVPEIIIISRFINPHHGVEVPAFTLLDTPTPRQKPYAIAHSIQ